MNYRIFLLAVVFAGCTHKDSVRAPLSITGFSPTSGLARTLVTISGSGFDPNAKNDIVTFNGVSATVVQVSDTGLVVEAPDKGSTGALQVTVGNWKLTAGMYTYQALSLRSASPLNGPVGTNIRISGAGFSSKDSPAVVTIGGVPAQITNANDTLLVAAVPQSAVTGAIEVVVNGDTVLGPVFLVQKITSIKPTNGGPGTIDTVRGSGFGTNNGALTLDFNGNGAILRSINDSVLIAAVPSGVSTGPVSVTMNGQKTVGPVFSVVPPPAISGVSPLSGLAGTTVTITGSNFSNTAGANQVDFDGTPATIVAVGSTKLLVTAPAGAKSGIIHVTTNGQSVSGPVYTYQSLNVTAISPDNGLDGTTVTISGSNFSTVPGATLVFFNGKPATVTSVTATQLVVTAPVGVTTGQVTVQVNGLPASGPVFRRAGVTTLFSLAGAYFTSITVDPSGNIYVTDEFKNRIVRVSADGSSNEVFAGSATGAQGFQNGNGTAALFSSPFSITVDGSGNLYVADFNNGAIRKITPSGDVSNWLQNVPAVGSSEEVCFAGSHLFLGLDNGLGFGSGFYDITGGTLAKVNAAAQVSAFALAADASGDIYYANDVNGTPQVVSLQQPGGAVIPTFASGFVQVGTLAVDPTTSDLFVGDATNGALYQVTPDGVNKTTIVGPGSGASVDGNLNQASFINIAALTIDNNGVVYIVDNHNTIRKLTLK